MLNNPSLLYLKYKGIPTPSDAEKNAKSIGFKCLKYSKWADVCPDENTPSVLRAIGASLVDQGAFLTEHYSTFAIVWERLRRWSKDKDNFAVEPDQQPEFEVLSRFVELGSLEPDVVDSVLMDHGIEANELDLDTRWLFFQALCLAQYFSESKRFRDEQVVKEINFDRTEWVVKTAEAVTLAYNLIGLDFEEGTDPEAIIRCMYEDLSLPVDPINVKRTSTARKTKRPTVWVDFKDLESSVLVNFKSSEGDMIVSVNKRHPALSESNQYLNAFADPKFWEIVGMAAKNNVVQLDAIQNFFDDFSKYYRLKAH